MSKHLLIGTAGHVDHGKTALIKALTGVDTDRLEEERERGISIVLGFAEYRPRAALDARVGIVDVPGHERFIKTMVAGATGVDLALFVVACDEGVKPQTREHLEILSLLGVRKGLVVLTKTDLVEDPEWVELVEEDVRDLVEPTFLAGAPVVAVSAVTGDGLETLVNRLDALLASVPDRPAGIAFRLPIDRSFTVKGIGTVVTGSVWSGAAAAGEPLQLQPSGESTRVREIQQHGETIERTVPGTRTALALHGVSVEEAAPGTWLVTPGAVRPSRTVDLEIHHLTSAPGPLEHNQRIRVHHGTQETFGRLRILGADEIAPGEDGFAQLHLEEPLVPAVGDRILVRRYSPMRTIAGGTILDVDPPRHRRWDEEAVASLRVRSAGDPVETVDLMVKGALLSGVDLVTALERSGLTEGALADAATERDWVVLDDLLLDGGSVERAVEEVAALLERTHDAHPLRRGLSAESIGAALGLAPGGPQLATVLARARQKGLIERDPPFWRRAGFEVRFEGALGKAAERLLGAARSRGMLPWSLAEAEREAAESLRSAGVASEPVADLLQAVEERGELVRYPDGFLIHRSGHEELLNRVREHFRDSAELTVADLRQLSGGLTRKYAIPILEYLDGRGYTVRRGDVRIPGPKFD